MTSNRINIGGSKNDPNYRYKRDTLSLKHESANGIQTRITNLSTVASQLELPSMKGTLIETIVKYMKKPLGMAIVTKERDAKSVDVLIKGRVEIGRLEEILNQFISEKILCPSEKCRLPEWDGTVCHACGFSVSKKTLTTRQSIDDDDSKKLEDEEKCVDQTSVVWEVDQSNVMKQLYAARYKTTSTAKMYPILNRALDACWSCNDEQKWTRLRGKVNELLKECDS